MEDNIYQQATRYLFTKECIMPEEYEREYWFDSIYIAIQDLSDTHITELFIYVLPNVKVDVSDILNKVTKGNHYDNIQELYDDFCLETEQAFGDSGPIEAEFREKIISQIDKESFIELLRTYSSINTLHKIIIQRHMK